MSPESVWDAARRARIGLAEAILCEGKTPAQIAAICAVATKDDRHPLLLTRLESTVFAALPPEVRREADYDALSRTALLGRLPAPTEAARIAVVTAGTSDIGVAREAVRTLAAYGEAATEWADIGVAGLWRLLERLEELKRFAVVIVVAGMDGALFSVIGGLLPGAIIAVPTSTGYGVSAKGETALHAALSSCAPGILVTNIDNGYGAACAALRILRAARQTPPAVA
ncbi:nickel pincer cofactor biosynthesis protein LarB [Shumkonia mesophila]|uniref:nickel pincer cofactor biosynthesis protein LarB n=1 Tax=Shumkonia mesophila TaxID=2838854 RepID=UPI002934285A|nr:nickel pincer cofactor biosynthesis protein LarB [Shumkonia mesophila]